MRRKILFSLSAIIAICGCQMKEMDVPVVEPKTFTSSIEGSEDCPETRTFMDGDGNVRWKAGDQVSIFVASTINEQYQVSDESDGRTSATLDRVSSPGFTAGVEIDNNVAFYPYSQACSIARSGDGYVVSAVLPSIQAYAVDSFGNGAFPMAAVTTCAEDLDLKFKNVLGGLKLQLTGTAKVASISIRGNNDEILCGTAEITVSNASTPVLSLSDQPAKSVTLDCGSGVQLSSENATSFVIALPPMTLSEGFTVTVTDTDGNQAELSTEKSQTIKRSTLLKMPVQNLTFPTVPSDEEFLRLFSLQASDKDKTFYLFREDTDPTWYISNTYQIVEKDSPDNVVYSYGDGVFHATPYAKSKYGLKDRNCSVSFKEGSAISFLSEVPEETKARVRCGTDENGLFIRFDNRLQTQLATDLLLTYGLVVEIEGLTAYEVRGGVTITPASFPGFFELQARDADLTLSVALNQPLYVPTNFQIVDKESPSNVIFTYSDGAFLATPYAKSKLGMKDRNCSVSFKEGSEISFLSEVPEETKARVRYGTDENGLFIKFDNRLQTQLATDLLLTYSLVVEIEGLPSCEVHGNLTIVN